MHPLIGATAVGADGTSWWVSTGVPLLVTAVIAIVVNIVARVVVARFQRRLEQAPSPSEAGNVQRAATLAHALSATIVVTVWAVAILIMLGYLGVNLAPLIAGAGIVGVALGFGAQSIVRDGLSGFFILLENQFGVGDSVEIRTTANPVAGKIEAFTLRATSLRSYDGTLNIVPNGNIVLVSNRSRGWARAIVDVSISYDEDVERVRQVLADLFDEMHQDESFPAWIMDGPTVLGVERAADSGITFRVVAQTAPAERADGERLLREEIARRLAREGIKTPGASSPPAVG